MLSRCLNSLSFCEELIVVDLESEDSTHEIAIQYNAKYLFHKKVPLVECIHVWIQNKINNEWVIISDPDEVCSKALADDIRKIVKNPPLTIGAVSVPWIFFFGGKMLKGTQWGGIQRRIYLVNLNRFYFTNHVHRGRHLKEQFDMLPLEYRGENYLEHYWMQNIFQLLKKHIRYLKLEDKSLYDSGMRTNLNQILCMPLTSFKESFIIKQGYRDSFTGLFLSFFWAWYRTAAYIKLWQYQKQRLCS